MQNSCEIKSKACSTEGQPQYISSGLANDTMQAQPVITYKRRLVGR